MLTKPGPFLIFLLVFSILRTADAEEPIASREQNFRVELVADGLTVPWGMVKLPDERFLVTERRGTLRIIENDTLLPQPVEGVPAVWAQGQGGLLDIQLHPDYARNGWIYLSFSKPIGDGALTAIARAKLEGNRLVDLQILFDPPPEEATKGGAHFGGRMAFDGQGHLFFSIGDRGDVTTPANNAQRLDNVKGKIHRIFDDGRIPPDNPFINTPGARPSIWSYGHRNPQGLVYDSAAKRLWETEHGPRGGDELNLILKGANFGWPVITYGINYNGTPITDHTSQLGMEQPAVYWVPSIAACGLAVYHGTRFPKWEGNLFAGALAHQKIVRIKLEGEKVVEQEILLEKTGRVRDVLCFDDGYLYVLYEQPGRIARLVPES